MNRRDVSKFIVLAPLATALLGMQTGSRLVVAQSDSQPGIPPTLPGSDRHDLWMYQNPREDAYIIAVEAERSGGWDDFFAESEDEDTGATEYVDSIDYVEDVEPVSLLDYGEKKTDGFLAGNGFIYDARDEADAAAAYRGFLNWEILGHFGYVALAAKGDLLFMVIGLQDDEVVLEDVLTWAVRDGELPGSIGDFILRPVTT